MKVYGYARVSTKKQSVDLQVEALSRYGKYAKVGNEHIEIVRIFTDTASGKDMERKEFQEMMKLLETNTTGIGAVVITKLDRIGRSLMDLMKISEWLDRKKIGLIAIESNINTTTSEGRLFFQILGALAEYERARILERTEAGKEAAREAGTKFGRKPVVVDLDEVRRRRAEGVPMTRIVKDIGISKSTVYARLREAGSVVI